MSNPYPPQRKLARSTSNKVLAGVCGGLAEYLNMDATLVRVLWVVLTLVTGGGIGIIAYIILALVLPEATAPAGGYPPVNGPQAGNEQYAPYQPPQQQPADPVWGNTGAPWEQSQPQSQQPPQAGFPPQGQPFPPQDQPFPPQDQPGFPAQDQPGFPAQPEPTPPTPTEPAAPTDPEAAPTAENGSSLDLGSTESTPVDSEGSSDSGESASTDDESGESGESGNKPS